MNMENEAQSKLEEVILSACDLPVLPITAQRVLGIMSDPDVSVDNIKQVISSDPGLATKLLKIANSAFYGGHRDIQNLQQAILRLGLNSVRNIIIATSLKNVYKRFGLTEKLLWEQSIGSAQASNLIAKSVAGIDVEDAFIGGLLHNVGMVILNNEFPDDFALVMEKVYNDGVTFTDAEKEIFDFTHRDVGALVIRKWGFPDSLESLVRDYDDEKVLSEDPSLLKLVSIISLSDLICQKLGVGWREPFEGDMDFGTLPNNLKVELEVLDDIIEKFQELMEEDGEVF